VGADGAGKTTMARRLESDGYLPLKYLYMGVSRQSSNRMLPTTWLIWRLKRLFGRAREEGGPPNPSRKRSSAKGSRKRILSHVKEGMYLANLLAEEWFRQLVTSYYQLRGYIVLFDRHFFLDYYAHDIAPQNDSRSLYRRVHGFLLERVFPRPGLVILLDAPADVLFARKPEGTVELIERRRQEYWRLKDKVPHFFVVDATQPQDDVAETIISCIRTYQQSAAPGEIVVER
jgi:thymidylate kinase